MGIWIGEDTWQGGSWWSRWSHICMQINQQWELTMTGRDNDGKETGTQIKGLDQKEEINIQPEQNEETRIQKNEERLRNLQDNFQHSDIQIIEVPEGKEKEQEIENLLENIMNENFLNLAKEIDFQKVQEAQRVPKKLDPRKHTTRHIIITLLKVKDEFVVILLFIIFIFFFLDKSL